ncbi:unannotated protein [freshwater metagenome]|uniref:Unannotated protein n=1 Tax=freshwater metagenome TaxID=449393 RepID=A0A6J5YJ37_9ZZZZ
MSSGERGSRFEKEIARLDVVAGWTHMVTDGNLGMHHNG